MDLLALFGFIVLVIAGLLVGFGCIVGAAVERRRYRRSTAQVPDAATVYEEGRAAGFAAGYVAGQQVARSGVRSPSDSATAPAENLQPLDASVRSEAFDGGSRRSADVPLPSMPAGGFADDGPIARTGADFRSRVVEQEASPERRPPVGGVSVPPSPTPEEAAAAKAARDIRNINIALYSASLLLVVAGGLFIGAAVPGAARAITICLVVALFYGSGLVLHARVPRLRPAAVAFAGTGLALLPVAGLLFGILTDQGRTAWFVTAVIGTAAYVLAAVRLQSRVVAYLTLPFFLSTALSSVSLIGAALVWYLTCSIGVAAVLAILVRLAPRWLPGIFTRALIDTHRWLTPLALGASLVLGDRLTSTDRALLWVVAAAYYAVMMSLGHDRRVLHFYALRVVGSVAAFYVASAVGLPDSWSVMVLTLCVALQVMGLTVAARWVTTLLATALRPEDPPGDDPSSTTEAGDRPVVSAARAYTTDLVATFGILALLAASVILAEFRVRVFAPMVAPDQLLPMLLVLVVGMVVATRRGGPLEVLVLPGVVLGLLTPWSDPWRTEIVLVITLAYLVGRAVRASGLHRERFTLAARSALTALAPVVVLVHLPSFVLTSESREELAGLALVALLVLNQVGEVLRLVRSGSATGELSESGVRTTSRDAAGAGAGADVSASASASASAGAGAGPVYGPVIVCGTGGAALLGTLVLAGSVQDGWLVPAAAWICLASGCLAALVLPLAGASRSRHTEVTAELNSEVTSGVSSEGSDESQGRSRSSSVWSELIEALGPASLVITAASHTLLGSGIRSYEILLAVAVVYCALMMRRAWERGRRGAYLLAAQLSFTVLTAVLAYDLDLSVHGAFAAVALGIALQEVVRVVLRIRLRDTGLQAPAAWFSVVLLGVFPFVYGAIAGEDARLDVIALHLILLAVISALLFLTQRWNAVLYPALYAVAALIAVLAGALSTAPAGLLPVAPLTDQVAALVSLACGGALVALRLRGRRTETASKAGSAGTVGTAGRVNTAGAVDTAGTAGSAGGVDSADTVGTARTVGAVNALDPVNHARFDSLRVAVLSGVVLFVLEAVFFAFADGAGWDRVVIAAFVGAACFALAGRERFAGLDLGGAVAVIVAATALVEEVTRYLGTPLGADPMRLLLGAVLAAAVLFAVRTATGPGQPDSRSVGRRGPVLGAASLGWSAIAAVIAMEPDASAIAGSLVLAAVAVLAVREVPSSHRSLAGEFAFLVVVGAAQRIAVLQFEGISFFWAAQWWVVAAALLAVHAFVRKGGLRGNAWLTAAAAILSTTGLSTIIGGTTQTQIWSLGGFVALLAAGVVLSRRRFSLWGAIGIALALLWFLRGFTFLLLTVAALLLIAFAVWKLNGQTRGPSEGRGDGTSGDDDGPDDRDRTASERIPGQTPGQTPEDAAGAGTGPSTGSQYRP